MKHKIVNEIALFAAFLFFGFLILPFAIYVVGGVVFGDYSGGYGQFFGRMSRGLVDGHWPTWFLVLSPYLLVQIVRLSLLGLRRTR
ncbi:MAG: hypothetical protein AAGA33_12490 [Pseudomonadota bacterium]